MLRNVPLIVILGSTGTGKTKLSIELAQRFGGEIISADSMQVYTGLDIITAKATKAEQSMAKHHLLDIVDGGSKFTVYNFRDRALPIIYNLLKAKKIPILVGGASFYMESILWKVLVHPPRDTKGKTESDDSHDLRDGNVMKDDEASSFDWPIRQIGGKFGRTAAELHKLLQSVDPDSAQRLHPNDIRRVTRALEIYENSGETLTTIFNKQRNMPGGNEYGAPRFDHTIMFWLQCDQDILNKRLDSRIDNMLSQGLIQEIRTFYNSCIGSVNENAFTGKIEYTKGSLQSIGLKEFLPYLEKYDEEEDERLIDFFMADKATQQSPPESLTLLKSCLETLRLVTKRYSRKQSKRVTSIFLRSDRSVPPMHILSTNNPVIWNEAVYRKAENVVQLYIDADLKPYELLSNPRASTFS